MEHSLWPNWHDEKPYAVLVTGILFLVLLGGVVFIVNAIKMNAYIGRAPFSPHTIAVTGEGKVTAVPDIATVSLGVDSQKPTQAEAVTDATNKMNALTAALKTLGIDDSDLNTQQYTVYPRYDYPNGRQVASGYEAQQQLSVKVRDEKKLPDVLKAANDLGANQIGDLQHTIDDPEPSRVQARAKAIQNAQMKAQTLAAQVGVTLGRVVSFDESSNEPTPGPIPYVASYGIGGGGTPTPDIQTGSQDIISDVTLTYEIY